MNTSPTALPYRQGKVLCNATTADWTPRAIEIAQAHESKLIFSNFTDTDEGRSRQYVAECATPEHAAFIVQACNEHGQLGVVRGLLETASTELEDAARVQVKLVEALQAAKRYVSLHGTDEQVVLVHEALALAGVA